MISYLLLALMAYGFGFIDGVLGGSIAFSLLLLVVASYIFGEKKL